ncbi:hypothetical protein MQE23_08355 [Streptomyces sp. HP-A2021]|uniref:hypothetical protein n=1 Tax=Streptomyces sp. HP-A2021 TaxID=2927875 RepID=UPI001FB02F02|nr:hypothetical protein [Streptomyces sp. HP-A2021]UOB09062.1 hypothetical protein MQE23_08355 [Streptomyces sp. HP-A2021]
MADDVTITVHVRDLTGPGFHSVSRNLHQLQRQANQMGGSLRIVGGQLGNVSNAASDAGQSLGGGMGLRGQAIAAAAALGTTLLPTIGALAPMLMGMTAVVGGGALALDDLKAKAKELKKPFEEWRDVAEKAVAPHTEKAVKSLQGAMKDLNPVIETGADSFGRIIEKASRFADSPAFQSALLTNVKMGSQWFEDFAGSIGRFTQSFLEFGAKSQPALDAWDSLLGGFLDTGLPKMFDGLEQGIGGSSALLSGLASFINDGLLPVLGKVAGSFTEAFGPLIGEMLEATGAALNTLGSGFEVVMELLEPFAGLMADAFRAMNDVAAIGTEVMGELASVVGGSLFEALMSVVGIDTSQLGNGFRGLSNWVKENEGAIRNAFVAIAQGVVDMVMIGVNALPLLVAGFRLMTSGVLTALDGIVSGAAKAFGWMPGIGDQMKTANAAFDEFASGFRKSLGTAQEKANEFASVATEKLSQGKLKLNISNWEAQIRIAKEQMKSVPPEKRAELKALIKDLQAKVDAAKKKVAELKGKSIGLSATDGISPKARAAYAAVQALHSKRITLTTEHRTIYTGKGGRGPNAASGGLLSKLPMQRLAGGGEVQYGPEGLISGPGSGTSDSIVAMFDSGAMARVSNTEFVVNAASTRRYLPLLEAINNNQLKLPGLARGGVTKAEAQARSSARGDLTISHFGRMAGHQRSEFRSGLGNPDSMRSLIDSLNQWRTIIMKATHGGQEKALLRVLDQTGKKLLNYEKALGSVTKSLEGARDKLNSLKQAASQLADSVKSGVLNSANITKRQGDGPVTVASIMGGLTASRDKATSFSKALADLKKKGLSSSLIQQIAEAGIDGGGLETAGALLGASKSEIKSMNSLQGQINSAATASGKTASDAVYKGAIAMQDRLVKSLTVQQSKLASSMDKLAAAMEKAIEKGFGKKASGGIIGAASGGARGSWTLVGEHEPELVRLPFGSRVYSGPDTRRMQQQAWTSMLNTPRSGGARYAPTPAGGSVQPIVVHQTITLDGRVLAQQIFDPFRREVASRGGNVQRALGQGAG